jgi:hypothetical protein
LFIPAQKVSVGGGVNYKNERFRSDIYTDGETSFSTEIGILNNLYSASIATRKVIIE